MQLALVEVGNQAINQLNWTDYAQLVHPEGLETFRLILMPGVEKLILDSQADSINIFGKYFKSEVIQNETPSEFFVDIMDMAVEVSIDLKNTFTGMANSNVGAVAEGDSLIHVITRTNLTIGNQQITEMNVSTLKKDGEEWKMVLSPKIEGIAMMMRRGLPQ